MSTTGTIGGVTVLIEDGGTLSIQTKLDERDRCRFIAADPTGTAIFFKDQKVTITETVAGILFTGYVNKAKRLNLVPDPFVWWDIDCLPPQYALDKRTSNRQYTYQYAGAIVADLYNRYMAPEGVIASTAVQIVTTPADWNVGSGTQGDIALIGKSRTWDDGVKTGQTLYGNGAPSDSVTGGQYYLFCNAQSETRSRLDFAGLWSGNYTIEVDIDVQGDVPRRGLTWQTTNFTNGDGSYAYALELLSTSMEIRRGTNGGANSSTQLGSITFSPKLAYGLYRVRIVKSGSTFS